MRRPPQIYSNGVQTPNYFRFRVSPEMILALGTKVMAPGEETIGQAAELLASHHSAPEEMDAYERLLGDAMNGDSTLFAREDAVEAAWRIVDPILGKATPVYEYEPGAWGPGEANADQPARRLAEPSGERAWGVGSMDWFDDEQITSSS